MNRLSLTPGVAQPFRATLVRNVTVALIVGTVAMLVSRGMPVSPGDWKGWIARVAAALWITLGGHYVELIYLLHVLPHLAVDGEPSNIARWLVRLGGRCVVWAVGGAVVWTAALSTFRLIAGGPWPEANEIPAILLQGAVGFIVLELFGVHVVLTIIGQPSAWARRHGRWG